MIVFSGWLWLVTAGASAADAPMVDRENESLVGKTVRCCLNNRCEDKPAAEGCRAPDGVAPPPTIDERPLQEARATIEELLAIDEPVTPRGKIAQAIRAGHQLVAGSVEAEQVVTVAVGESHVIETRCSIRIDHAFTTDRLQSGERIEVWYRGGYISPERFQVVSHEPKCAPFDYGIFALGGSREGWRIQDSATFSMLNSGARWDEHWLSRVVDETVVAMAGVQR